MRSKYPMLLLCAACLAVLWWLSIGPAHAAVPVTWNVAGNGTWDTVTGNWTGGSPTANLYVNGDTAIFSNTAGGTITLAASINPGAIQVSAASGLYKFAGVTLNGSGPLTKSGGGSLEFSVANASYSGNIDVQGGMLTLDVANAAGTGIVTLNSDTTVSYNAAILANSIFTPKLNIVGTGIVLTSAYNTYDVGAISGSGTVVINAPTKTTGIRDMSSFSGALTVSTPTALAWDNSLQTTSGSSSASFVLPGSTTTSILYTLDNTLAGTCYLGALSGSGRVTSRSGRRTTTPVTVTIEVGGLNTDSTFSGFIDNSYNPGAGGSNSNAIQAIRKVGTGTLTLSGTNTYTGTTTVNGGKLSIIGSLAAGSAVTVNEGGKLGGTGTVNGSVTVSDGITTGGIIEGGVGGSGMLTINNNLTFSGLGAINTSVLNGTAPSLNIHTTTSTGTLTANGAANSITINIGGGTLPVGTYKVAAYDAFAGTNFLTAFNMGVQPGRSSGSLAVNPSGANEIDYVVSSSDFPIWTGSLDNTWTNGSQSAPKNWVLNSNNATATDFLGGDKVVFDGAAGISHAAVEIAANVNPGEVNIDTSSFDYAFNSAGGFGIVSSAFVSGSLTKTGTGKLTLNTINTFTGPVTIGGGTLEIPAVGALGAGSNVNIDNATLRYTGTSAMDGHALSVGSTGPAAIEVANGASTLTMSGAIASSAAATLQKTGDGTLVLTNASAGFNNAGAIVVNAGTLKMNAAGFAAGSLGLGLAPVTVNTGATLELASNFNAGYSRSITIDGGTLNITSGTGADSSQYINNLTLQNGASVAGNPIRLGYYSDPALTVGGSSASTLSSGILLFNATGRAAATFQTDADLTVGAIVDYSANAGLPLAKSGSGTMTLTANNSFSGSVTINNGTLQIGNGGTTGTLGSATEVYNSGTLAFNRSNNFTVAANISGTGNLVKSGGGALTLTGASNSYFGATTVNAGKLITTADILYTSSVTIGNNAVLAGTGAIGTNGIYGAVSVLSGGGLENSNGSGTLSIANGATFGGAGAITVVTDTGLTPIDVVVGLTLNGGANSVSIYASFATPPVSGSDYHVLHYDTLNGAFSAFKLGSPSRTLTLVNNSGFVDVHYNAAAYVNWRGDTGGSGTEWSIRSLTPKNWTLSTDSSVTDFMASDPVVFGNTALNTTVDISQGDVLPVSVTFNNTDINYTLQGTHGISGGTGIVKNGGGSVTINNANSFNGGLTINAGAVVLGNAAALAAGNVLTFGSAAPAGTKLQLGGNSAVFSGLSTNAAIPGSPMIENANDAAANFTVNVADYLTDTFAGVLRDGAGATMNGALALAKGGNGTLVLSGNNGFTGGVTINAGVLQLGNAGALNAAATNVVAFGASVPYGAGLRINGHGITIAGLASSATAGNAIVDNSNAAGAAVTVVVPDTVTMSFNGSLQDGLGIGALSLVKDGLGTQVLASPSFYTGGTTVKAGTLRFSDAAALGTNTIVMNGGTLQSTVSPGYPSIANALNIVGVNNVLTAITSQITYIGPITGNGSIEVAAPTGNWTGIHDLSGFSGTFTTSSDVALAWDTYANTLTTSGSANAKFIVNARLFTLDNAQTGGTCYLGELSGGSSGSLLAKIARGGGTVILEVGGLNTDSTFAGTIVNNGGSGSTAIQSLKKVGTGTLTLTGNLSYTGDTTVNGGTLTVNNLISSPNVYVATVATLNAASIVANTLTIGGPPLAAASANASVPEPSTLALLALAGLALVGAYSRRK